MCNSPATHDPRRSQLSGLGLHSVDTPEVVTVRPLRDAVAVVLEFQRVLTSDANIGADRKGSYGHRIPLLGSKNYVRAPLSGYCYWNRLFYYQSGIALFIVTTIAMVSLIPHIRRIRVASFTCQYSVTVAFEGWLTASDCTVIRPVSVVPY